MQNSETEVSADLLERIRHLEELVKEATADSVPTWYEHA